MTTQPLWKEELWQAISCAVLAGATPKEAVTELISCWLEAIDDSKKCAESEFAEIIRR